MTKGRKSTPDSVKRMKGTDQPVRLRGDKKMDLPVITKLPSPRGLTPKGRKIYKRVGKLLMDLGILNEMNFSHFYQYVKETELYLETMSKMPTAEEMIHTITDANDNTHTRVKALRKIAQDALKNSKELGAEFGLTPTAQARIIGLAKPTPLPDKNPLEQFLDGQ